jgi:hypothetical protein
MWSISPRAALAVCRVLSAQTREIWVLVSAARDAT